MKYWMAFSFTDTTHLLPMARAAEEAGFEGVFLADHAMVPSKIESPYPYNDDGAPPFDASVHHPDVWAAMSAMAAVTTTLRFSIGTFILPLHDVFAVARGAATASVLSEGRAGFSVGAGWMKEEFDIKNIDFKTRGRRMDEMIEVMRKLWTGEAVEHHGRFYDFPPVTLQPAPAAPIPILVAGKSKPALRRTAQLGDGWIGMGNPPEEAEEILDEIARLRAEAGRADAPFECIVPLVNEPDAAVYERLAAKGMTASVSYPASMALGTPNPSLDQELDYIRGFGENVIGKFSGPGRG